MEFVERRWKNGPWKEKLRVDDDGESLCVRAATGGWSGNEDLIMALKENFIFWSLCWQMSARGGLHRFKVRNVPDEGG